MTAEYIYWDDGRFIGRHKVNLRNDKEGVMPDGRVVYKIDGRWVYKGE